MYNAKASIAALLVMVGMGGSSYALWHDSANTSTSNIQSGDLDLKLNGNTNWYDSGNKLIDASDYLAQPGDNFTIKQDFQSKLTGDNIIGKISTSWDKPAALSNSNATYSILDSNGKALVSNTPLGDSSVIKNLPEGDKNYTFEIKLAFPNDMKYEWVSLPDNSDGSKVNIGDIKLDLDQVREGNGYKS